MSIWKTILATAGAWKGVARGKLLSGSGALIVGILELTATHSALAQSTAQSIEIETGWGGLGNPQHAVVAIRNEKGLYYRGGDRVDPAFVEALIHALRAPSITKPEMDNLGVTATWLDTRLRAAEKALSSQIMNATRSQIRLFEDSFRDPKVMAEAVADRFNYGSTDDYPYARVQVVLNDGTKLSASTHSYYVFMIPWTTGKETRTYNADLSRAVSSLLPPKTPEKDRLAGTGFDESLAEALMRLIQDHWNMLGVEARAASPISILREHYKVLRTDINPYHDVYFGRRWAEKGPHETNLQFWLHNESLPANLNEHLVLEFNRGKVEGLEDFLRDGSRYEKLALSVPWLNEWLREHPRETMTLAYVHEASFGDHAMESFAADMKARGRQDLIAPVRMHRKDIALLHIGFVYWLLFPDRSMLLWRFEGPRGFLKWKESDFPAGECDRYYAVNNGGCSGREVSPEGQLLPEAQPRDRTCTAPWRKNHPIPNPLPDSLFSISENGREGMIDARGNIVIPPCFDGIADFSEGLARFERDGLWGYANAAGEVMIPPTFPWAEPFHDGLAWVQMLGHALEADARWGVIDKTGRTVVAPTYKRITSGDGEQDAFHEGLAMVEVADELDFPHYGYIDRTGKMIIGSRFTLAYPFSEGAAAVTESGFSGTQKWGFIDRTGNWVIPPQFSWASDFVNGLAAVSLNGECGYIDRTGKMMVHPPTPDSEKDCATVWGDFSDGLSRWRFGKKFGYIDKQGRTVITPAFDLTYGFSEGLAAVRVGHEWGYVDINGKMVIPLREFKSVSAFHHGLARITAEHGFGYIDRAGKMVWFGAYE